MLNKPLFNVYYGSFICVSCGGHRSENHILCLPRINSLVGKGRQFSKQCILQCETIGMRKWSFCNWRLLGLTQQPLPLFFFWNGSWIFLWKLPFLLFHVLWLELWEYNLNMANQNIVYFGPQRLAQRWSLWSKASNLLQSEAILECSMAYSGNIQTFGYGWRIGSKRGKLGDKIKMMGRNSLWKNLYAMLENLNSFLKRWEGLKGF